jgi:hypothetical protein
LLLHWLRAERVTAALLALTLGIAAWLLAGQPPKPGDHELLLVAVLGLGLWFYGGPSLLFGLGYLAVLPARGMSGLCEMLREMRARRPALPRPLRQAAVLIALLGLLGLTLAFPALSLSVRFALLAFVWFAAVAAAAPAAAEGLAIRREGWSQQLAALSLFAAGMVAQAHAQAGTGIFLPPQLRTPRAVVPSRLDGFLLWTPADGDQCWAAELPCAPSLPKFSVRLRDPAHGFAGGFERAAR